MNLKKAVPNLREADHQIRVGLGLIDLLLCGHRSKDYPLVHSTLYQ